MRGWKNSKAFPAQNEVERLGRAIEEADEKLLASLLGACRAKWGQECGFLLYLHRRLYVP